MERILYICQFNSGRSLMAEAITNSLPSKKFRGYSAGIETSGEVSDLVLSVLTENGHDTSRVRTKTVDHFTGLMAVEFNYVITACDASTSQACPVWPGQPVSARWNIPKPSIDLDDRDSALEVLRESYDNIFTTITMFTSLPREARARMSVPAAVSKVA